MGKAELHFFVFCKLLVSLSVSNNWTSGSEMYQNFNERERKLGAWEFSRTSVDLDYFMVFTYYVLPVYSYIYYILIIMQY